VGPSGTDRSPRRLTMDVIERVAAEVERIDAEVAAEVAGPLPS
jgi:hypothetical protein